MPMKHTETSQTYEMSGTDTYRLVLFFTSFGRQASHDMSPLTRRDPGMLLR